MEYRNIFLNPIFWNYFVSIMEVEKSWKCNFSPNILLNNISVDAALYDGNSILKYRRLGAREWMMNDTLWTTTVINACREIAESRSGHFSKVLREYHMLDALADFVEHINCFHKVATIMAGKGQKMPLIQNFLHLHDIDKLDPIMLVGYSEKFEDGKDTLLWNVCVERHIQVNVHHQGNHLWHKKCSKNCTDAKEQALQEMVCDKVSRRLQKNLNGVVGDKMWDVDMQYFNGLPQEWMSKAVELMRQMKLH